MLQVHDLETRFFTRAGVVFAVDGVTFEVGEGETLGIVGESGCGKSVTATSIMRLIPSPPGKIVGGKILLNYDGKTIDLVTLPNDELRHVRGNVVSMIFQDPMTSLNPVYTVGNQLMEPLMLHLKLDKKKLASGYRSAPSGRHSGRRRIGSMPFRINSPVACASA